MLIQRKSHKSEAIIRVKNLSKHFYIKKYQKNLLSSFKGIFKSEKKEFSAVDDISFSIKRGERVAFIGPNGAGKSTTIKMLTGILYPTQGDISVLGNCPWENRKSLGYDIGIVLGQRTQLWYHLSPIDSYKLLAKIYEIPPSLFKSRLEKLLTTFELEPFLYIPVKQLSLGQKMKCEIVASLLHHPKILFLDEPTIGLDINAKLMIRNLLTKISEEEKTTLFLTSHDTMDIEKVCNRVIVLDQGKIMVDTSVSNLRKTYMKKKIVTVVSDREDFSIHMPGVKVLERSPFQFKAEIDTKITSIDKFVSEAIKGVQIKDLNIEDLSMEEVIRLLYRGNA